MADYLVTDTELTSVANAIRTKGGTSANLSFPTGFVSAIEAIATGKRVAMGSFTPTAEVTTSTTVTIASLSSIGFSPRTMILIPHSYESTNGYIRLSIVFPYDGSDSAATYKPDHYGFYSTGNAYGNGQFVWSSRMRQSNFEASPGYLGIINDNLVFRASSSHKLKAQRYDWYVVEG